MPVAEGVAIVGDALASVWESARGYVRDGLQGGYGRSCAIRRCARDDSPLRHDWGCARGAGRGHSPRRGVLDDELGYGNDEECADLRNDARGFVGKIVGGDRHGCGDRGSTTRELGREDTADEPVV